MVDSQERGHTVTAREEVLQRIQSALGRPATPAAPPSPPGDLPRAYRMSGVPHAGRLAALLADRLTDYRAHVSRCTPGHLTAVAAGALTRRGASRVVVPPGLETTGLDLPVVAELAGVEFVTDDGLTPAELDAVDGVITGAAVAIAETGTIVMDASPGQGRRAISLIPDYHLCVVHASQIVALVPEAIARLTPARPLTWVSGPSATSDIELSRVEGVHGPRTLEVIIVTPRAPRPADR